MDGVAWASRARRLRRWGLPISGAAIFVWLRVEDNHLLPVVLLGWMSAVVLAGSWALTVAASFRWEVLPPSLALPLGALAGAGTGLGAALITPVLMLLKNGLHAHLFPDFPFGVITGVLVLAPAWLFSGMLIGAGLVLVIWAVSPASPAGDEAG